MAIGRLLSYALVVATIVACGLEEEGLAPPLGSGGASGSVATGGAPAGGSFSGGAWSGGQGGSGGLAGSDASAGSSGTAAGAGGVAGSDASAGAGGTAGASGGTAGASGGTAGAGAKGGTGGTTAIDCTTLFAGVPNIEVCTNPPAGVCKVAYGATLGKTQSCNGVCGTVGKTCAGALDDNANQTCMEISTATLDCGYTPNKAVCFCST